MQATGRAIGGVVYGRDNAAQRVELKGGARAKQRGPRRVGTNFLYYLIFATFGVLRDAIVRQANKSIDDTAREYRLYVAFLATGSDK